MTIYKKIVLVPFCIFHQQPICSTASKGVTAFDSVIDWVSSENYYTFPIPCPKLDFKQSGCTDLSLQESTSLAYRIHCKNVIKPLVEHLKSLESIYGKTIGTIGLQGSSTCDTINGVLMHELHKQLISNHISIDIEWYIPNRISPTFNPLEHYISHN